MTPADTIPSDRDVALVPENEDVPVEELVHIGWCRKLITKELIESFAIEKYRTNGRGITIEDLKTKFSVKITRAQRSFKYFLSTGVLFTAQDLLLQGVVVLQNKNPQQYYASSIKAEILENEKKKKSALVQPTGVSYSKKLTYPLSNALEHQKASSFLEVLATLPYAPPYLHKLQLMFHLDKEFYYELKKREKPVNRAKTYEEIIGRRHVTYKLSPNGTVEVYVKSTDTPIRIEKEEDISAIFAFLGQVRDRLLYHISDIRERYVPPLLNWVLKQCDLNKDIEISDTAQIALPDIQLIQADRVFRLYVKIVDGRAHCRGEEQLTLNQLLPEALDTIRHPYKSIEEKMDIVIELLKGRT